MKKTVLVALVALFSVVSMNAQTYVGGSIGFWHDSDAESTSFSIAPEIGHNLNDKWAIGTEISFSYLDTEVGSTNTFGIAPYARYTYFKQDRFSLFVDGGFSIFKAKDIDAAWNLGLKPGFAVKLTDKFSLVSKFGFLGYQDASEYAKLGLMDNGFGFNFKNNVSFGFYVNF